MGNYMEKYFGKYTEEDLKQARETLAAGRGGKSEDLRIIDHTGATYTHQHGKEYIDCTSQAWSLNIGGGRQESSMWSPSKCNIQARAQRLQPSRNFC
jgi:4-aminobutyrate aminotransferase-like enzyme